MKMVSKKKKKKPIERVKGQEKGKWGKRKTMRNKEREGGWGKVREKKKEKKMTDGKGVIEEKVGKERTEWRNEDVSWYTF